MTDFTWSINRWSHFYNTNEDFLRVKRQTVITDTKITRFMCKISILVLDKNSFSFRNRIYTTNESCPLKWLPWEAKYFTLAMLPYLELFSYAFLQNQFIKQMRKNILLTMYSDLIFLPEIVLSILVTHLILMFKTTPVFYLI